MGESDFGGDFSGGLSGTGGLSEGGLGGYEGAVDGFGGFSGFGEPDYGMSLESLFNADDFGGSLSGLNDQADYGNAVDGFGSFGFGEAEEEGLGSRISNAFNSPFGRFGMAALGMINPTAAQALGMVGKAATASQSPGKAGGVFGGMALGALGGALGGPLGAIAGNYAGSQLGSAALGAMPGYSGPASTPGIGEQGEGMGNVLGTLGSLYQGYQGSRDIGGQIKGLQSLYGQNSPYSQMLRQQLERRDAAGGRRSQYGPREVELQAKLAEMNSRNAPTLAGLYDRKMANRNMMLKGLGYGYDQMGGIGGISRGLQGLFSSPQPFDLGGYGDGISGQDFGGFSTGGGLSGMSPPELPDLWGG